MDPRTPVLIVVAALAAAGCEPVPEEQPAVDPPPVASAPPAEKAAKPLPLSPELTAMARLIADDRIDRARTSLEVYVADHPHDGRAAFLLGLTYHREKRYTLAEPWFDNAAELAPDYYTVHHFHGWCLYYLGDMPAARTAFKLHLESAPGEGDSHFALGLIALDEDRLDDAERRFVKAIELQRDNPGRRRDVSKAHARLADVHMRRDELEQAKTRLQVATELWPQHYTAFYKLSRVLNRLGENQAADEAFRQYRVWETRAKVRRGVPEPAP